jgi:mevalonate kinase
MVRKSAKNSALLKGVKEKTSTKMYAILVKLVGDDREDLAEIVLKIDFLLEYASTCLKQRDISGAKDSLDKARARIDMLKKEGIDTEYLDYLYDGILNKTKK